MDLNSILIIVGIVLLLGVAGGCVFGIMKIREIIGMLDTKVSPKLDEVKQITEGLKPAVAQSEGLLQSVNVAMDALDVTLLDVDDKLNQISSLTGKVTGVLEAAPEAAGKAKSSLKAKLFKRG